MIIPQIRILLPSPLVATNPPHVTLLAITPSFEATMFQDPMV